MKFTILRSMDLSDSGDLQIRVYANNVGQPIENAHVKILEQNTNRIIEELSTNTSGKTDNIELQTPPVDYSLNYTAEKPYSEYNLVVEADGFEKVYIEGVQLLPESLALQNVKLEYKKNTQEDATDIIINKHALWGDYPAKTPEEEVKILPESSGFIVLPEPVIPEYVIVHLGNPNNSAAKNVWVPFTDYIKNVASSEIYSTWPTETIKANVLAIISFTLNRVYTEWYQGKGYDFTITNSTAFDHAFNYGRNIFEEISLIVDEIFDTYITKPNIKQPLFTQYCDGKRVNCSKGMKQWGSKDLGDSGYSAENILKSYYGYDIYLEHANKVEGIPKSYEGTVLTIGSTGNSVRTIQEQLNKISANYPAIIKLKVDGIYGNNTQKAVKTFQEVFDIPANGIVDFTTWYKISNIYVAITKLSEL